MRLFFSFFTHLRYRVRHKKSWYQSIDNFETRGLRAKNSLQSVALALLHSKYRVEIGALMPGEWSWLLPLEEARRHWRLLDWVIWLWFWRRFWRPSWRKRMHDHQHVLILAQDWNNL